MKLIRTVQANLTIVNSVKMKQCVNKLLHKNSRPITLISYESTQINLGINMGGGTPALQYSNLV